MRLVLCFVSCEIEHYQVRQFLRCCYNLSITLCSLLCVQLLILKLFVIIAGFFLAFDYGFETSDTDSFFIMKSNIVIFKRTQCHWLLLVLENSLRGGEIVLERSWIWNIFAYIISQSTYIFSWFFIWC